MFQSPILEGPELDAAIQMFHLFWEDCKDDIQFILVCMWLLLPFCAFCCWTLWGSYWSISTACCGPSEWQHNLPFHQPLTQFCVICKLCLTVHLINEAVKRYWPQCEPLGYTSSDWPPAGLGALRYSQSLICCKVAEPNLQLQIFRWSRILCWCQKLLAFQPLLLREVSVSQSDKQGVCLPPLKYVWKLGILLYSQSRVSEDPASLLFWSSPEGAWSEARWVLGLCPGHSCWKHVQGVSGPSFPQTAAQVTAASVGCLLVVVHTQAFL